MKARLGILLSGRGSNFTAIHRAIASGELPNAEIAVVISSKADAPGLAFAKAQGCPAMAFVKGDYADRESYDAAITEALQRHRVDLVILAGWDRILTSILLKVYADRILNIHPSLLPKYGGKNMVGDNVHAAVLAGKETESGCTVHLVTETVDGGRILGQSCVPVAPGDTPQTLAARVLEQEHRLYPKIIAQTVESLINSGGCGSYAQA